MDEQFAPDDFTADLPPRCVPARPKRKFSLGAALHLDELHRVRPAITLAGGPYIQALMKNRRAWK